MSNTHFNGLTMPVFSAFGWAGEETAINFALSQLELFIDALFFSLPRDIQAQYPFHGLDNASQSAYLSENEAPESGLYIAFFARPMSLEVSVVLTNKKGLDKTYKAAERQPEVFIDLLKDLGSEWSLRIQQMEFDEETGSMTHYQDLFKDDIDNIEADSFTEIIARAAFLNRESQWVVPIYLSCRKGSERVAAMGRTVVSVTAGDIATTMPLSKFMTGQVRKLKKAKVKSPERARRAVDETPIKRPTDAIELERFTYASELQPLHIRRGFVNLTPNHWPFFAINVRTETRQVVLKYEELTDNKSAVWRLVPTDQARLVLSPIAQQWLEDNFGPGDHIQVTATKEDKDKIVITLAQID